LSAVRGEPGGPPGFYAGIGSRATPQCELARIEELAESLARGGWALRTGASPGADAAFFAGASRGRGQVELFLPWPGFERELWEHADRALVRVLEQASPGALALAARTHPGWTSLGADERALAARDSHQVLGADLDSPAAFVACWTPGASLDGDAEAGEGTAQALRIAHARGIPAFNTARAGDLERLYRALS